MDTCVPVLDDALAFLVSCRCGQRPMELPEVIVELAKNHGLAWQLARDILGVWVRQERYEIAHLQQAISGLERLR